MTHIEAMKMALDALEVANSCVDGYYIPKGKTHLPEVEQAITAIKEALAQPERKPLTDEQIRDLWSWSMTAEAERTANTQQHAFARAIEAAHGIKEGNLT